jgi:prepilin-type N-terminal cleavage/methylation domain-containing protein
MTAMTTRRQRGFTLFEVLLALACSALLLSSVMPMLSMSIATATSSATSDQADLERQAAFAVERIARVVRATAPPVPALAAAGDPTTTGAWLVPSAFQLAGAAPPYTLVETRTGDNVQHVLADSVTAVAFTELPLADGRQLVQVDLTLAKGNASTTVSSVMRMGWLQ